MRRPKLMFSHSAKKKNMFLVVYKCFGSPINPTATVKQSKTAIVGAHMHTHIFNSVNPGNSY